MSARAYGPRKVEEIPENIVSTAMDRLHEHERILLASHKSYVYTGCASPLTTAVCRYIGTKGKECGTYMKSAWGSWGFLGEAGELPENEPRYDESLNVTRRRQSISKKSEH